jgi:hypothetical protein
MTLDFVFDRIESEDTSHYAEHVGNGMWAVTWLPNRALDRNSAITAMTLAEEIGQGRDGIDGNFSMDRWVRIKDWSKELGVPPLVAVRLIEPVVISSSEEEE